VHYGTIDGEYTQVVNIYNVTSCNLDLLTLVPTQTYFFAVSAYSTTSREGPLSASVFYIDSPHIVEYPSIDYANKTIDVTFSENNMQGADVKSNYTFSPAIIFEEALDIVRPDEINRPRTYRFFMNDIPEDTIITLALSNVTDNKGLALISDSIVLNDDDEDGMADDWEIQNGLNPLLDDGTGDIAGDGISNLDEYNEGTAASNMGPEKPVLNLPGDLSANVQLTPELKTNPYVDHENDTHLKTQWQISTESSFTISENILFMLETYNSLTVLTVPEFILDTGETYFWRARFFDIQGEGSLWSDSFSFSTVINNSEDFDGNGVPDIQQVTEVNLDLNNDGYFDVSSSTYKMGTNGRTAFSLEASDNVTAVDRIKFIDPSDISDTSGKPDNLDFGLIQFKIRVDNIGDTAEVKIYFSEPVGTNWYKYDLINGWTEYSKDYPGNVELDSDGKSVRLRLVDGGPGDSDGVANGVIVDPSGPGAIADISSDDTGTSLSSSSGGGGGGCFIATAAFGSYMEKHVQILKDFRDIYLLKSESGKAFVKVYYRYSPPIADFIARHGVLRAVVRTGLMPLVGFGYVVIHTSPFEQEMMFLLIISLLAVAVIRISRRRI
jgi:hypothetical protein